MEAKPEEMHFYMPSITNMERDFGYISTMLRWKDIRFFGPPPRDYYQAADFFTENATQRIMVRQREADVTVIAYAEFSFYPLIGALPADCWIHWLKQHFCTSDKYPLTWGDTMFFTRFIFFPKYNPTLLNRILEEFFHREFKIRYVVVLQMPDDDSLLPEDTPCYDMLEGLSTVLYPRNFSVQQCHNVQRLHIIHRNKVIESMRFRKALPEDNDDIVEVIDVERPDLREEYGDFYIAEELQKEIDENDTHNTFIACELQHQTVGFIWLNDDVSIQTLVENFDCEGYGNMIRFSHDKPYLEKRMTVSGIEKKPYHKLFTPEVVNEIYDEDLERLIIKTLKGHTKDFTCTRPTCPGVQAKLQMGCGAGDTDDKYFLLREEFLRKMQLIETYFASPEHYQVGFRKRLRILYNVPQSYNHAEDGEFPFDTYSNVFAIKLLGLNETTDMRYASRLIATAFTAHPERDYCIISIPNKVQISRSVAMLLGIFVSLVPRPGSKIDDNVYIINRSTIFGYMGAMNILPEDVAYVEKILEKSNAMLNKRASTYSVTISHHIILSPEAMAETRLVQAVLADVFDNPNSDYHFLTIRCGDSMRSMESTTIVGFVIIRPFYRQVELGYKYYFMLNELSFKRTPGEIVLLRLHPNFMWESDAIFRHISCATGYWEFYYLAPTLSELKPLANDLVKQMQPIEPRHIAQIHRKDYTKPPPAAIEDLQVDENITYSIYYHNLLPSKTFGNSDPIIIIGFNNLTRALLRKLLFNFTNSSVRKGHCCLPRLRVIVIAAVGLLEGAYDSNFRCGVCDNQDDCYINFENSHSYVRDTTRCMDFRKFFSFVSSSVEEIKRDEHTVVLANGCELYYSKLILSLNQRFGLPPAVHDNSYPTNYAQINHRVDKIKMYYKLEAIVNDRIANDINIIVFGAHIQSFEFIDFLLKHKISPHAITMIIPWNPQVTENSMKYNISHIDLNIELILQQMIEDLGIKVQTQWILKNYIFYHNEYIISHVTFERYPDGDLMTLPCDLFVSFTLKDTVLPTQGLMLKTGLEMEDNCVLVDESFCTTDPDIYAIGNFTRLRNEVNHQYLNVSNEEIASKLIYCLKLNEDVDTEYSLKYSRPIFFQAQLPKGYYMAKVVLPKRYIANHLDNTYSVSLTTYDGNFSRVRLNEHGIVEEVVCVTQTRRKFDHLQYFVGQHESLLNDLHSRWYLNEIPSIVDFFEEPWTELIMHPNYNDLRRRIRTFTIDSAREIMREHPHMDRKSRKEYMKHYMTHFQHTTEIEKTLLRFLRRHRDDFVYPFALPEDFQLNLAGKLNI
ncbi:cilia- and flagella-associated protein 61-like isoform X2 [Eurosta solidaginis]|uniref:cilia- and flagella-associated protein 61-like isoform X2 n=1 Tax=Eurosta solidaginis TaxID=178769 RepID=UPI0035308F41